MQSRKRPAADVQDVGAAGTKNEERLQKRIHPYQEHGATEQPGHGMPNIPGSAAASVAQSQLPATGPRIPPGWLETPAMGAPWEGLIPLKVPLGSKYHEVVPEHKRFTPQMVLGRLAEEGKEVGLVLDLTKSWAYYDDEEWLGASRHKVAMQGRGAVPEPELINHITWLYINYRQQFKDKYILVHCTHGYNRTGYVIVSLMARLKNMPIADAIRTFSKLRSPGIYKEDYVQKLFEYYHERRLSVMAPPPLPPWKDEDVEEAPPEFEPVLADDDAIRPPHMAHDDIIGEGIDENEALAVQQLVMQFISAQALEQGRVYFPGSQPVSLARSNLQLLKQMPYKVTWKADGTRYMLLLCRWGAYVIDRSFRVRRTQLRCPTVQKGVMHHNTLLDGEMVVDEDAKTKVCRRRYLAYDIMVLNNQNVSYRRFEERLHMVRQHIIQPRDKERSRPDNRYLYEQEEFGLRDKGFWDLDRTEYLLTKFMQGLTHESDGLIFQPAHDAYAPGTCEELLKWKFAHMNSVDFLLRQSSSGGFQLFLMKAGRGGAGSEPSLAPLPDARVVFPEGHEPTEYVNRVIECCWDSEQNAWRYMRHRLDKEYPNAWHVYEKVLRSIKDNITEQELVNFVKQPSHKRAIAAAQQHEQQQQEQAAGRARAAEVPRAHSKSQAAAGIDTGAQQAAAASAEQPRGCDVSADGQTGTLMAADGEDKPATVASQGQ